MARLDARQAAFCRHYALEKKSATEAAKLAGYSPSYANRQAAKLVDKPQIKARIEELQRRVDDQFVVTPAQVRRGIYHEAQNADSAAARIRAWELLGKDLGMFTDRTEHSGGITIEVIYADAD